MHAARVTAAAAAAAIYQHEHRHAEQRRGRDERTSTSLDELGLLSPFVGMHLPFPSTREDRGKYTQHPEASTQRPAFPALSLSYSLTPLVKPAQDPPPTQSFLLPTPPPGHARFVNVCVPVGAQLSGVGGESYGLSDAGEERPRPRAYWREFSSIDHATSQNRADE